MNKWIRQAHRWLSIAFTVVVIVNGVAVAEGKYTNKLGLSAVFVLGLEYLSGLYLFGPTLCREVAQRLASRLIENWPRRATK